METKMENIIIVGSGPAGLTAAIYCARANLNPLVLEGPQPGGQLTTTTDVENFPGFENPISGFDLVMAMRAQAERIGARLLMEQVVGSDFSSDVKKITLASGETLEARSVIIATGASARYLGLPSEQALINHGVSGCATCDGSFYRGKDVAVVGGGDTAMEEALYLSRIASSVTLIHRRDEFRASKVMGERVLATENIKMAWNSVVDEVLGVENKEVSGVRLRDVNTGEKRDIAVSALFVAIGHTPNSKPFRDQIECDETGYIIADNCRTSVAGVFAAGDIHDSVYRQAVTAAGSGCKAALEVERYLAMKG
ncbi:MAG: thioredoxin-disulfide reductase [Lentisphaerae bacterium]|jgi:thioredoxin reductase (NADPH)|nr:thioredoxin-disulfide reductase [Lentisphaerota bacterium]